MFAPVTSATTGEVEWINVNQIVRMARIQKRKRGITYEVTLATKSNGTFEEFVETPEKVNEYISKQHRF